MAPLYNFTIDQGATVALAIQYQDATGNPFNLTSMSLASQAKTAYAAPSASFAFSVPVTSAVNGQFLLSLAPSQSAAIPAGNYVYDVVMNNPATGEELRLLEGILTISPGVTR
jgi:hypothetical protein